MCYPRSRLKCFNPRARGGRDALLKDGESVSYSFNPRARGGRDVETFIVLDGIMVSIHAPAGGATVAS